MKNFFKILILSLLFLSTAFGAKIPQDTIIVGIEAETPRINPLYDEDHDPTLSLVFSGLTNHDENSNLVPELATSWKVSEDGKVYEFVLREDVLWHDGVKFSPEDVKFTIEAAKDEKLNAPAISNYEMVKSVEVTGPNSVKITLSEPFPPFLDTLSFGMLPKHILEGKDINSDEFNNKPVGTGAYKVTEWKKGEYIKFVANDKFYKGAPKTKNIFLKVLADANIRLLQLKSGEIDAALIDPSGVKSVEKSKTLKVLRFASADYRALMFNMNDELFKDKNVRKAINYAVDKSSFVNVLLHGYGFEAHNPIQTSWANSDDKELMFKYDPKKADELLKQSGWSKNKKGFYEKDGKTLGFEILAFNTDPFRVSLAKALSSELVKFGIDAKAYGKPKTAFEISKVQSFVIGWGSPFDPDFHTYRIFGSFADVDKNENGWNYSHYSDENVDKALKSARSTQNMDERKKFYKEFLKAIHDNPPFVFIAYLDFPLVYNNEISGIKTRNLGHHGAGFLWNIHEWQKQVK